jgi:predicted kinase
MGRRVGAARGGESSLKKLARGLAGLLERSGEDLSRIAATINWDFAPDRLQAGDLKGLNSSVQEAIRKAAAKSDVIALARRLGLAPIALVIGLMAQAVAQRNRSARRLARAILPDAVSEEQKSVARGLGLG